MRFADGKIKRLCKVCSKTKDRAKCIRGLFVFEIQLSVFFFSVIFYCRQRKFDRYRTFWIITIDERYDRENCWINKINIRYRIPAKLLSCSAIFEYHRARACMCVEHRVFLLFGLTVTMEFRASHNAYTKRR